MKTQRDAFFTRTTPTVCRAVMYAGLPESALAWGRVEYVTNGARFGSGESASFGSAVTVRKDGVQVYHDKMRSRYETREELLARVLPGAALILCGEHRGRAVYVIQPAAPSEEKP